MSQIAVKTRCEHLIVVPSANHRSSGYLVLDVDDDLQPLGPMWPTLAEAVEYGALLMEFWQLPTRW